MRTESAAASAQVDRLFLVLAVAALYTVSEGVLLIESGAREIVDAHSRRGINCFQFGCRSFQ